MFASFAKENLTSLTLFNLDLGAERNQVEITCILTRFSDDSAVEISVMFINETKVSS